MFSKGGAVTRHYVTHAEKSVARPALVMGCFGSLVGGVNAAVGNFRKVKRKEIDREEAVKETLREAMGSGIATAISVAGVQTIGASGFIALLGMVIVGAGTRYLWEMGTAP